jgi:hypothetical protein
MRKTGFDVKKRKSEEKIRGQITRYGSALLIRSTASRIRRRMLMIIHETMHTWSKS